MKTLLTILVLLFSSSLFAEDISDFEIEDISDFAIEGMSIGDSLLEYLSEEEIINEIEFNKSVYAYLPEKFGEVYKFNQLKKYDFVSFFVKLNDIKYISYAVSGGIYYKNINECFSEQNKIFKELEKLFTNQEVYQDVFIHRGDETGESKVHTLIYFFKNEDTVRVECYEYGKEYKKINNFEDSLIISIVKEEVSDWFDN